MADVKVDVKVDDKGSLNQVGKSAQSARRQIGGVAKTASAGGKQFSKMSQGITGGLVPAYAQLAATLFAVDALLRAFKQSADLRVQREGMIAYANESGRAMQSVARNLQDATDAQLSFTEAASASAIGLAAGLNAEQMNEIGKAARNASIALGRNFTDSFDRVLKGIVKGEPELLDELGIILRLDTATRKYADALNIAQDDLTAFQRSQAVYNEVIGQAQTKYEKMAQSVDVSAVQKLATALEDIKNTAMEALAPLIEFFSGVFAGNLTAAISLLLVFAASVINKVIPSLTELRGSMSKLAGSTMASFTGSIQAGKTTMAEMKGAYQTARSSPAQLQKRTAKAAGAFGPTKSQTITALANGEKLNAQQLASTKRMLKKAEMEYKKHGKITTGYLKGEDIKKVRNLKLSINQMNSATRNWGRVTIQTAKLAGMGMVHAIKTAGTMVVGMFKVMGLAAKGFAFVANAAMKAAGFVGMAVMIMQIFKELQRNADKIFKFMATAMEKMANIMRSLADKMPFEWMKAGLTAAADKADSAASSLETMAEKKTEALANQRDAAELQERIDAIAESARKTAKELTNMAAARGPIGDETTAERLTINRNLVTTGGASLVSQMRDLSKLQGGDKKAAAKNIAEGLRALKDVDRGFFMLGANLELMAASGNLSNKALEDIITSTELLNTKQGSGGASLAAVGEEVESLSKTMKEMGSNTKGYTNAMINSLGKMVPEFAELAKHGDDLVDGNLRKYLQLVIGKQAAAEITTTAEALSVLNLKYEEHKDIMQGIFDQQLAIEQSKIDALGSKGRGAAVAKEINHLSKIVNLEGAIADAKLKQQIADQAVDTFEGLDTERAKLEQEAKLAAKRVEFTQKALDVEKKAYSVIGQMQMSIENHFTKMFEDLATGAATLGDALKKLFQSVLLDLARILAKQAAVRAMGAVFGLERGGIIPMAKGGMIPKYGMGGVATEPTYLVGEGKNHEAVVPLPDNRSIPVKLQGNTGGTNNVTVNVDATGGSTTTSVGDAQARQLGQMVAAAVQAEIIDQKRPGGILSPYGDGDY